MKTQGPFHKSFDLLEYLSGTDPDNKQLKATDKNHLKILEKALKKPGKRALENPEKPEKRLKILRPCESEERRGRSFQKAEFF